MKRQQSRLEQPVVRARRSTAASAARGIPRSNRRFAGRMRIGLSVITCVLLAGRAVHGADDAGVAGGYLRFGASARSLGLGNAVAGIADDVATSYWNPAGLAQLRTMELTGMGATLVEGTKYSFLALGMPTEKWGTFALGGTFTGSGDFERATLFEDLDETFSEKEGIVSLSYARGGGRFAYGLTLKSVSQNIGGAKGNSSGMDAGVYFRPHRNLSLGAALQNLVAPRLTLDQDEEKLAQSLRGGIALRFFNNRLLVVNDIVKTEHMDASFRSGIEVWPLGLLALRGGWDSEREHMSAGAGIRYQNWQLDYTYVSTDLGAQNVVSATMRFGVPFGVTMASDRQLFSPSGSDRDVTFDIATAVRGSIESWRVEIADEQGRVVRVLNGNGHPPEGVSWGGEDEDGRLVGDGRYDARVVILDDLGQQWQYATNVEVLGFQDRTRVPIKVEINGGTSPTGGNR